MMSKYEITKYNMMIEYGIVTKEELNLARNLVDGSWDEVLNAVCRVRTGYRTFESYLESEHDDDILGLENF